MRTRDLKKFATRLVGTHDFSLQKNDFCSCEAVLRTQCICIVIPLVGLALFFTGPHQIFKIRILVTRIGSKTKVEFETPSKADVT